jgi:glutamine synthetase
MTEADKISHDAASFFEQHPRIETVEAFVVDVNGVLRGKWLPRDGMKKAISAGLRLPLSAFAPDIWGNDVPGTGLIVETGDNDGVCSFVPDSLCVVPWLEAPTAQVMLQSDFFGDPRHVLAHVLSLYKKAGLTPVVAAELEFYLLDVTRDEKGAPQPPLNPSTRRRADEAHTYNLGEAEAFRKTFADISQFCRLQGIPADTMISENGPGQFEINLNHVPDALKAADHAVLIKRVIKGVAQRDGMAATFMAKPYAGKSGSGMHVHFSVLDKRGKNIFAGKDAKGSPALRHAIGGLLAAMADSMAILAPNANSYRRFQAGSHAPVKATWGYDNRSAALRVPESDIDATRIEYRVAGADVNPYLVLAVILGGALEGLTKKIKPAAPIKGNAAEAKAPALPTSWESALVLFEKSKFVDRFIGKKYKKLYLACKRQEKALLESQVSSAEHDAYLRDI